MLLAFLADSVLIFRRLGSQRSWKCKRVSRKSCPGIAALLRLQVSGDAFQVC